jgi:hypothetical protein
MRLQLRGRQRRVIEPERRDSPPRTLERREVKPLASIAGLGIELAVVGKISRMDG